MYRSTAKGKTGNPVANAQLNFVVSLPSVSNCGSATAVAAGDEGSHAEFNLSQTVWLGEPMREGRLAPALSVDRRAGPTSPSSIRAENTRRPKRRQSA